MIKSLYYGNIVRSEHIIKTAEYKKLSEEWFALADSFEKTLSQKQRNLLNQIIDMMGRCNEMTCAAVYETGFCDGAKIMLEILNGSNKVNV